MKLGTKCKILKNFLDVITVAGAIYFIGIVVWYVRNVKTNILIKGINIVTLLSGSICLFFMIFSLREILRTVLKDKAFQRKNVIRIKNVSMGSFGIALCYLVNIFVNQKIGDMKLIVVDDFGIHTDWDFIIFLIAGSFIYVLAKVFESAVKYKEENDLTI